MLALSLLSLLAGPAQARSLDEVVKLALDFHPQVSSARAEQRATAAELQVAQAGWLPTLDLAGQVGRERTDIASLADSGDGRKTLSTREAGLTLAMNLFNGHKTRAEVARRNALYESAGYQVEDTREAVAARSVEVFLEVLRGRELLALAEDNVKSHATMADKVKRSVDRGVGQKADFQQVQGRLALANATLVARKGDLDQARARYQRVVGELPGDLQAPAPAAPLAVGVNGGAGLDTILQQALDGLPENPAVQSAESELVAAGLAADSARGNYLPKLDLEVQMNRDYNVSGIRGHRDADALMLVANWNLYKGGADQALERALVERQFAAKDTLLDTRLAVEENIRVAMNSKATTETRMQYLQSHVDASRETLDAYRAQFELNRRSLLDVLNAESELFTARSNLVNGRYDDLLNQYLLHASQGHLIEYLGLAANSE